MISDGFVDINLKISNSLIFSRGKQVPGERHFFDIRLDGFVKSPFCSLREHFGRT